MERYRYLLFDLDGTLTDPFEGITSAVQYALAQFGIQEPELKKLTHFIGPPLHKQFMESYGFSREQALEAVRQYRVYFADKGIFQNRLYEGMDALLAGLRQRGYVLMVASSKPQVFVEKVLHHFHIYSYFHYIAGSELDGSRIEKDEVIRYVLDMAGVTDLSGVLMIGDRKYDVEGAHALGVPCVGVSFGYGGRQELEAAGADYIADTVEELGRLLME